MVDRKSCNFRIVCHFARFTQAGGAKKKQHQYGGEVYKENLDFEHFKLVHVNIYEFDLIQLFR